MKLRTTLMITTLALCSTFASALEFTVLNTGSKTGGFGVESNAYQQDLAKANKIEYVSPGQYCAAYNILSKMTTPVLFPWANDWEAMGRDGKGCATMKFKPEQIVRFNTDPMFVCSLKSEFTRAGFTERGRGYRVGHTAPDFAYRRTVLAVNESFGTQHKPVTYDGSGAVKTALLNGEVDYALLSTKFVGEIESAKGTCHYTMSSQERLGKPGIGKLDPKNKRLLLGNTTLWLMFNVDAKTALAVKSQLEAIHADPSSAINKAMPAGLTIDWKQSTDSIITDWNQSVVNMQQ